MIADIFMNRPLDVASGWLAGWLYLHLKLHG